MALPGPGQPTVLRNFLEWLKVQIGPMWLVPLILLAGYHLMWALSGTRYDVASLLVTAAIGAVAVLAITLWKALGVGEAWGLRAFLVVAGLGAAAFGIMLYLGAAGLDSTATNVVSVIVMAAGLLAAIAAAYLHPEQSEPQADHPAHVDQRAIELAGGGGTALLRTFRSYGGRGIDRILAAAESQISIEDLHYVAYHVDGYCCFSLDVLDDDALPADDKVTSDQRRSQYLKHGVSLNRLISGLNEEFRKIDSGILLRVVLDVERGALYYFWVDDARFVIGVTVDQSQVHKADQKMVQLVDALRPLLGHKRIEDLNR